MVKRLSKDIKNLINYYKSVVTGIDIEAKRAKKRAYGGIIRSGKGNLVENLAENLIKIAWRELGRDLSILSFEKKTVKVPIRKEYIERIKNPDVKKFIEEHKKDYYYPLKTDIHVHVDGKFRIAMECKSYTENAMLKRILVDFTLFKQVFPQLVFVLFQLESQLGGDYSSENFIKFGSPSTHTLLSYFDIDLNIITLLEGERKVDKPIHKPEFYKPLKEKNLLIALNVLKDLLK